jgi:ABC-type antimicrobial peptide transport system permease subunit
MSNRGNLKMAIVSLRAARLRNLLTMLGIIIGIVSVVTVVGIGEGVKAQVAKQINHFGKDLITVRPGHVANRSAAASIENTDLLFGLNSISGLSGHDLDTVKKTSHVTLAAPLGVVPGAVQVDDGPQHDSSLVLATNADLPGVLNQAVLYGSFFGGEDEQDNVAVIGRSTAQRLFQESVPLGRQFTFRGQTFIVRGIFSDFDSTPLSPTADFNNAIFIPYLTADRLTGNSTQMYTILAKPDATKNTTPAIAALDRNLLKQHGGQQDFTVLNAQENVATSGNVLNLLTSLITMVAAISLLVGGVGIMNIMLVSVTERMHEIGVRKAVGATNRQILSQFVMEATVLSVAGGVIGMVLSLVVDLLLHAYSSLKPVISWQALVAATLISIVIGVVFGAAPAIKAARKDPIEALRHE